MPDFVLTVVSPDAAAAGVDVAIPGGGPAIAFAVDGEAMLDAGDGSFALEHGGAAYVSGEPTLHVRGDARVFIATTRV
ncbi:MAG: hypothetical protein ABI632_11350 [Pseudolysinimonas sp.]